MTARNDSPTIPPCGFTSSRMSTAGAAMLPTLAMVDTSPIPVCLRSKPSER